LPDKLDPTALEPPREFEVGSMVWVPDDHDVANAALVEEPFAPGAKGSVKFDDGLVVKLMPEETASVLHMDQQVLDEKIHDLITLDQLNEYAVLYKLRTRFEKDLIYTSVSSVLISINPCKQLDICGAEMMRKYKAGAAVDNPNGERLPHVFRVGLEAYESLLRDKRSQSILVSGESGAGKTEATKLLLKYLAEASDLAKRAANGESEDEQEDRMSRLSNASDASTVDAVIPVSSVGKKLMVHRRSTNIDRPSLWTTGSSQSVLGPGEVARESLVHGLESQILQASPLLEAFGNAKTIRNHNSSRFGKMVTVKFSELGYITGASIANYLLEKSRVTTQSANERSYHIFYQLLAGLSSDTMGSIRPTDDDSADDGAATDSFSARVQLLREQLLVPIDDTTDKVDGASAKAPASVRLTRSLSAAKMRIKGLQMEFVYLASGTDEGGSSLNVDVEDFSSSGDEDGADEEDDDDEGQMMVGKKADKQNDASDLLLFKETVEAMGALRIPTDEINGVLSMLAAVLQSGNVTFEEDMEQSGSSAATFDSRIHVCNAPQSKQRFDRVASLLGIPPHALERVLCSRTMGGGRGSTYQVFYTTGEARSNLDSMVKLVYSSLFNYLVFMVNHAFEVGMTEPKTAKAAPKHLADVHLLDIFGFEIFESNSFEQLCINYCNETLQQFFNRYIFMLEQEEYERQGIKIAAVDFEDNSECLELLQGKAGVFRMLDEEGKIPKGADRGLLSKILTKHQKHPNIERTHIKVLNANMCFSVRHFAGTVAYDVTGFLTKNKDHLHPDILDALNETSQPFVATIMKFKESNSAETSAKGGTEGGGSGSSGSSYSYSCASKKKKDKKGGDKGGGKTMIDKFQSQIGDLMEGLGKTQPHFIRCLKPNDQLQPAKVDAVKLHYQLHRNGLLQVCKMRQIGYPIRVSHHIFYERYLPVVKTLAMAPSPSMLKTLKAEKTELKSKKEGKSKNARATMAAAKGYNAKSALFSGAGGRFTWPEKYNAAAHDALLLFLHSLGGLQTGQFARGTTKIFLRTAAQQRLHVWPQQVIWAGPMLQHFRLLAVARMRYRHYREQLAVLMNAMQARSLPRIKAQLQVIEKGSKAGVALPYGGRNTKEVKTVTAALPKLREEEVAKLRLREAVEARQMEELQAALAHAASFHQPTLDQSAEAEAARTMMKLLVREEDLKAALAAATKERNLGDLRVLLAEARALRLLVDANAGPDEGEVHSALQLPRCVEVEAAVKVWDTVEASMAELRRMRAPGANLFKLREVLDAARELGVDRDTSVSGESQKKGRSGTEDAEGAEGAEGESVSAQAEDEEAMSGAELVKSVETMHEDQLVRLQKRKARLEVLLEGKEGGATTDPAAGDGTEGEDNANMASVVAELRRMAMQMDAAAQRIHLLQPSGDVQVGPDKGDATPKKEALEMLEAWPPYAAATEILGVTDRVLATLEQAMVDGDFPVLEAALAKAEAAGPALEAAPQVIEAKAFRKKVLTVKEGLVEAMDTRNRSRLDRLIPQAEQLGVPMVELQRAVQVRLVLDLPAASVARDLSTLRTILAGLDQLGASAHQFEEIAAAEALVRQLDAIGTLRQFISTVEAQRSDMVAGGGEGAQDGEANGDASETIQRLKELIELAVEAMRADAAEDSDSIERSSDEAAEAADGDSSAADSSAADSSAADSSAADGESGAVPMFVPAERRAKASIPRRAKAEAEAEAARVLLSARELLRSLEAEKSLLEELREAVGRQELAALAEVLINAAKVHTLDGNPELLAAKDSFLEMRGRYKGVVQEGWLWKMGEGKHALQTKFRKRWMVLENGELTYYKDQKKDDYKGVVNLAQVLRVQVDTGSSSSGHKYVFKLITERRVWVLRAESAAALKSWSEDLRNAALAQQLSREHTNRMQQWDSMHFGGGHVAHASRERVDSVLTMKMVSPVLNKRQQPESKVNKIDTLEQAERLHTMFASAALVVRQLQEYMLVAHLLDSSYLAESGSKSSRGTNESIHSVHLNGADDELQEEEDGQEGAEGGGIDGEDEDAEELEEGSEHVLPEGADDGDDFRHKASTRVELNRHHGEGHDREVLQKAFEVLDHNGDGLVGEEDVERTLRRINRDPIHHLELFRKFGERGIDQDQVTLLEWIFGFTMHCPGLLPDWVNVLEAKYNSAIRTVPEIGAAGETKEGAPVTMYHPLMSGTLATGTVLVKQDLVRMDQMFKPVDWRQAFFALLGHTLFIFDDGYAMQVRHDANVLMQA
jgi:hypothetical protein